MESITTEGIRMERELKSDGKWNPTSKQGAGFSRSVTKGGKVEQQEHLRLYRVVLLTRRRFREHLSCELTMLWDVPSTVHRRNPMSLALALILLRVVSKNGALIKTVVVGGTTT
jgi:hypothetical protein